MHMADALTSPAVAGTMYALSTVAAGYSIKKVKLEADPKKAPIMGVMGAFVFATQMINFTIPGTGSSGHLCGGFLLTALLGPYAAFLTMIGVLLIQCMMFADGGLLALGANVWNMAFYGCFMGYFLFWKPFTAKKATRGRIIAASILGCIVSLQFGAFSVTIQTMLSGITDLPFSVFVGTMQPIHLAIGFVEGLITSAVLVFVYESRPEMLYQVCTEKKERISLKKILAILSVCVVVIAGGISLFASSHPDGLEWSIEKITGSTELEETKKPKVAETSQTVQEWTSLFPDYSLKSSDSVLGTSVSGIVGSAIVLLVCGGACWIFTKKKKHA